MEREATRGPNGFVVALAILGGLAICGMFAACSVGYMVYSRYEAQQAARLAQKVQADTAEAAAVKARALAPHLAALPPPVVAMSADKKIVRDETLDLEGAYQPNSPAGIGKYSLREIELGSNNDFGAFEHAGFAQVRPPLEFVFDMLAADDKSQTTPLRITANSYRLTRERIEFTAYDSRIGKIGFVGHIDPAFLIRLADTNHRATFEGPDIMKGDLTIGDKLVRGVGLGYVINVPATD